MGRTGPLRPIAKRRGGGEHRPGKTVGSPVTATDEDGDTLTYTLTAMVALTATRLTFTIDWGTGQINDQGPGSGRTKRPTKDTSTDWHNYDGRGAGHGPDGHAQEADPPTTANSADDVMVEITVTDVNEAPAVTGAPTVTFNEDTGVIDTVLAPTRRPTRTMARRHPTWSVGGADGSKFYIGNETDGIPGELKFKKKPNYEKPTDANKDNVYEVTVQASDARQDRHDEGEGNRRERGGSWGGDPEQGSAAGRHPGDGQARPTRRQHLQAHLAVEYDGNVTG